MPGTLFVVGTPIGNLEDLSVRAARVLREVSAIFAEDTRAAKTLLGQVDALGPVNPARRVTSYFEGNEAERATELAAALAAGQDVAVISEAGMPGISTEVMVRRTSGASAGSRGLGRTAAISSGSVS